MHYPHSPHRSNYFTSFRRGDWKVVYHYFPSKASEDSHYQLFNLVEDPFESTNLAASQPKQLRSMMQDLAASLLACDAQYPVDKDDGVTPLAPKVP